MTSCTTSPPPSTRAGSIRVRGVTRRFGDKLALAPLDLDVGPGGITGLLGPNGSGKSTFLRCLVGLVRPDAGVVEVDGVTLTGDGLNIRKRVSYSPGELAVYGGLSGKAHLEWLLAGRERQALARALELAKQLELPLHQKLRSYSHGMKRQLFFAAAMAPRVRIRLLDEITEGLDPSKRGVVHEHLREDAASGTTILLSSPHLGEVQRVCDSLVFMRAGQMLSLEKAEAVRSRSRKIVRLTYREAEDLQPIEATALAAGAVQVKRSSGRLSLHLASEDPRAILTQLFARQDLPRPLKIDYGELVLEDLYTELYGEQAC